MKRVVGSGNPGIVEIEERTRRIRQGNIHRMDNEVRN